MTVVYTASNSGCYLTMDAANWYILFMLIVAMETSFVFLSDINGGF